LPFVWPYAVAFWIVDVWAFWPEIGIVRRSQRSANSTDSRSLQVILLGMWVAYFGAFLLAWVPLQIAPAHRVAVFWLGLALMALGSLLRRHCWRMLGASFTGDVRARPDQQVVTRGAYLLLNTGIGVALGSWVSTVLLVVTSCAVYGYRIAVEERALLAAIGEPYRKFMSTRKRLIPFVY
jgi:protein-S-isoprenylcysteine O-methyltransferase